MALNVRDSSTFSLIIERIKHEKGAPYMETIIEYCEEEKLDLEEIGGLVSQSLKEKIQIEAQGLNYLPKTATLPFS